MCTGDVADYVKGAIMRKYLRYFIWAFVFMSPLAATTHAVAGIYKDDLTRCILSSAKTEDRDAFLRWVFAAMATNPKIRDMAKISSEQSEAMSRTTAQLMQRIILVDCKPQTVEAIKYEGGSAIQEAFSVLGQSAMADLMRGEETNRYMGSLDQFLDQEKWNALMREAGIMRQTPETKKN